MAEEESAWEKREREERESQNPLHGMIGALRGAMPSPESQYAGDIINMAMRLMEQDRYTPESAIEDSVRIYALAEIAAKKRYGIKK